MSLMSELKGSGSVLSAFMAAQFPQVKVLGGVFGRMTLRHSGRPPQQGRVSRGAPSTPRSTTGCGTRQRHQHAAGDGRARHRRAGNDLGLLLGELIAAERPACRSRLLAPLAPAEARFARFCYAMAWFEEVYQTGRLWPGTPLGDAGPGFTVDDLLDAVPAYAVDDLVAQAALASGALRKLRTACPPASVHAGPDFAGSPDVGGADADLIVGDLLVDVKGTAVPSRLRKPEFYRLLGYALLDYDGEYRIERLGFYLSRIGRLITWPIEEYLAMLGSRWSIGELRRARGEALALGLSACTLDGMN